MMDAQNRDDPRQLAGQLRRLLLAIEASGQAILPSSNDQLLQSIVEAAARIFDAAAASIALVDEDGQQLYFKVAHGVGSETVVGMRVPINRGIAGYVAMSGQPIAISNVREDTRFNQDFARSTGYVPQSILAMPLISGDRVIGVMEVLDKIDQASFGLRDMELLGIFARQAAIAIDQSQHMDQVGRTVLLSLEALASEDPGAYEKLLEGLVAARDYRDQAGDVLELAGLFYEISQMGDAERRLLMEVFTAFRNYRRTRAGTFFFDQG
jgi:GAF domain-containing protein